MKEESLCHSYLINLICLGSVKDIFHQLHPLSPLQVGLFFLIQFFSHPHFSAIKMGFMTTSRCTI